MLPSFESVQANPDASFFCRTFDLPCFPFRWHLHPEYELTLITQGRGRRFVGDSIEDFSESEVILLGPNLPHTWHSQIEKGRRSRSVVIQFRGDCWGEHFLELPELINVRRLLGRSSTGLQFTGPARRRAADMMVRMESMPPATRLAALLEILEDLSLCRQTRKLATRAQSIPQRQHDQQRIDKVMRHVNQHYQQPLDQQAIADMLHLSPSAFSRFFKRMTGRTFVDFVTNLRLSHATRLLMNTDEPVLAIALDAGFTNLSNFNRLFRARFGCSPRAYRQAGRSR
jgi:AraC-like DNA-binding protein